MRIVHIFRAPAGGLFRHVRDLARGQSALGHELGIICDTGSGDDLAEAHLASVEPYCSLGIHRIAMSRLPGLGDLSSTRKVIASASGIRPDILHGHGAKGGLFARLAAPRVDARSVYTPHGGVLHFDWSDPRGALYLFAEKALLGRTDGLLFVCRYEQDGYRKKIGGLKTPSTVVHNGLWPEEFEPIETERDATDIVFIGELRTLKGVDDLLDALAIMNASRPVTATLTGSGPDEPSFRSRVTTVGLNDRVRFTGALPARTAFAKGRVMVIPSRAESFPYIVLEAIAAQKPIVATNVGGIGEVIDPSELAAPRDPEALARLMAATLDSPKAAAELARKRAKHLAQAMSAEKMAREIAAFYSKILS